MAMKHTVLIAGAACLLFAAADAAPWGKPGLWQMSTTMQTEMPGMPKLTAQQLAQMKKMGIKMPAAGEPIETKVCETAADVASFDASRYNNHSGCKQTSMTRTGNHIHTTVACDGDMKGNGFSDVTLAGDGQYSSTFAFKGVSHGHPVDMKVATDAKWLGKHCGAIKPFHG
jgi:hypothetical protein